MELSDYDILGVTSKATFRVVRHAYYELSRIYHPDSPQILIGMTKEERLTAFQRIQKAFENIKEKLNVVEIDLPQEEIDYKDDKFDKPIIQKNSELIELDDKEFNKKFNIQFEKEYKKENIDNPFSLNYLEPGQSKRNLPESKLIIKGNTSYKNNNIYEFGINYIQDHSCENYYDIRHLNNYSNESNPRNASNESNPRNASNESNASNPRNASNDSNEKIEPIKEEVDKEFDKKLEELIKIREVKIEMSEHELNFINRQKRVQREIEESKRKVTENRNKLLITNQ